MFHVKHINTKYCVCLCETFHVKHIAFCETSIFILNETLYLVFQSILYISIIFILDQTIEHKFYIFKPSAMCTDDMWADAYVVLGTLADADT